MPETSFPKRIQIQTTVGCGADCTICPHPVQSPNWSNGPISDELFGAIVDQLRGRPVEYVAPYLMADPLADKQIFDRVHELRDALPNATIELSTTGKYLVPKLAERLLATPVTELRISSHGITAEEYARTMPGVNFDRAWKNIHAFLDAWRATQPFELSIVCLWGLWPEEREREIADYWRGQGASLSQWRVISRSNQVDLTVFGEGSADPTLYARQKRAGPYLCRQHRDTEWMHILSDGRVTLCCMDYAHEEVIGDLRQQTIAEIWNGDAMRTVRARIRGVDGDPPELCQRCEWHVADEVFHAQQQRNKQQRLQPAATGVLA